MTENNLTVWLKNWKRNLLEVFVIAGILASAFTTFTGAFQLVNRSVPVALLFTAFFQGGIYVVGHYTSVSEHERERRRTFTLCLVWAVLAFFSVYASSLGMFDIQQESLRSDRSRVNVFTQWIDATKALAEFKTRGLAEINQAKQAGAQIGPEPSLQLRCYEFLPMLRAKDAVRKVADVCVTLASLLSQPSLRD